MENSTENKSLSLKDRTLEYLEESSKWAKFLAIIGFIFIGLMFVYILVFNQLFSNMPSGEAIDNMPVTAIMTIYILFLAIIYFFPVYFLFKFASETKKAIAGQGEDHLRIAFRNLRNHYLYIGILVIIFLVLYLIMLAVMTFAFQHMNFPMNFPGT